MARRGAPAQRGAVDFSAEEYPVGRNKLEPRTFASYAVSGTSLFIRTEKLLYRVQNSE